MNNDWYVLDLNLHLLSVVPLNTDILTSPKAPGLVFLRGPEAHTMAELVGDKERKILVTDEYIWENTSASFTGRSLKTFFIVFTLAVSTICVLQSNNPRGTLVRSW